MMNSLLHLGNQIRFAAEGLAEEMVRQEHSVYYV